ncbi:TPA: FAD-binding oxidoreductase [Enterobacter hormaechei subsp. steigerwaltii]|nr:FAD-binding oxidoreductase [Enterobacter hormaechei subsp. steigerwaltii]
MSIYVNPANNNYPGLDRGFNQRFKLDESLSQDPDSGEGIYLASDASDIVSTLNNITASYSPQSGEIKVISGGHCYENFTFQQADETDTGVKTRFVIDLSNMRGISEETLSDNNTYIVVEPGASNWLIQQTLHSTYGAALPGGSCYSVCAGGHISGGGYGLLSRLHGLTVDYLAGVEMVIPDLENGGFTIRNFDPASDSDQLDWASRGGGGGHFGIITRYFFRKDKIPAAPERALFIALPVPWSQFTSGSEFAAFLQAYYTACAALPGQAFTLGKFTYKTSVDDVMSIVMQVVYGASSGHSESLGGTEIAPLDTQTDAMALITDFANSLAQWVAAPGTSVYRQQPYTLRGHPVSGTVSLDTVYDLPWIDMTQLLNGSGDNQNGKYKSSYMVDNFNVEEGSAIYDFLTDSQAGNAAPAVADKSQTLIQIDSYGMQINQMDDDAMRNTAIAARGSLLKTQYQTYWKDYAQTPPEQAKINEQTIVNWFNAGYNYIHSQAQPDVTENKGFPVWGTKYQGCYFNYPDRQLGVNAGYTGDLNPYTGDFLEIYFGTDVATTLKAIKANTDPNNIFAYSQSVLHPVSS